MDRGNNFDLLRFLLAFTVFLYHVHILSQREELQFLSAWASADMAVKGFFVVSGYLVFMSHERAAGIRDYFEKRARRIYPAYFWIVCACAVGGFFVTSAPAREYFSLGVVRYLAANLAFLNFLAPTLPGVFAGNPFTPAVNGALWTIKVEVMFYLCVPLIAWLTRRNRGGLWLAAIYALSVVYTLSLTHLATATGKPIYQTLAMQLPGQMTYFTVGIALYRYRNEIAGWLRLLLVPALAVFLLTDRTALTFLEPAGLGILVIFVASRMRYLGNFGRYGDFSYGIYIIHFPVLQTMITFGLFDHNAYGALAAATVAVVGGAFLWWHLIEKRWLARTSHYVLATTSDGEASRESTARHAG